MLKKYQVMFLTIIIIMGCMISASIVFAQQEDVPLFKLNFQNELNAYVKSEDDWIAPAHSQEVKYDSESQFISNSEKSELVFDNINQYFPEQTFPKTGKIVIKFKLNNSESTDNNCLFNIFTNSDNRFYFRIRKDNRFHIFYKSPVSSVQLGADADDYDLSEWQEITIKWNILNQKGPGPEQLWILLNGEKISQRVGYGDGFSPCELTNSTKIVVGSNTYDGEEFSQNFSGKIDEFVIY